MDTDDFQSLPSLPTVRAGGTDALGRIDHYDILRKLGGGGFGVVYLARDTASGVEVALKTLHPLLKSNAEEMDLLREKFKLVSRLSHPNIATALVLHPVRELNVWDETARRELRLSPGDSVMVMRYAPGVTLSKWRRQFPGGSVPLAQALEIGRQIASALDYAHGEKIVHRDIKPANVMVETQAGDAGRLHPEGAPAAHGAASGPSGRLPPGVASDASEAIRRAEGADAGEAGRPKIRVRILDFGLAAEIRSSMSRISTETGDTSGTRPYMAPEQWLGRKQDGRTDQYALACVLYELISGAPPFAGVFETGDPIIMRTAVERDAPDEVGDVPPAVNAALQKALSKNPVDRFNSCGEFVAACLAQRPEVRRLDAQNAAKANNRAQSPKGGDDGANRPQALSGLRESLKPALNLFRRCVSGISKALSALLEKKSEAVSQSLFRNGRQRRPLPAAAKPIIAAGACLVIFAIVLANCSYGGYVEDKITAPFFLGWLFVIVGSLFFVGKAHAAKVISVGLVIWTIICCVIAVNLSNDARRTQELKKIEDNIRRNSAPKYQPLMPYSVPYLSY